MSTAGCTVCGRDNDNGTHAALEATGHLSHSYDPVRPAAIDAEHIAHQREWSSATFGPDARTQGVIDHIRKELVEIEADPLDLGEWVDVIILGFDGAWRAGHEPQAIIDAIKAKQARNEAREWPDWRLADRTKAIEHVREPGETGTPPVCVLCGRERTAHDVYDYNPLQVVMNQPLGWYSGDDGEMCPECMTRTIRNQ